MNFYELKLENDRLLKVTEFVKFCIDHQGQDIVIQVNNEGHCLRFTGVYDILDLFKFNSVTLKTWNIVEHHPTYTIDTTLWNWWLTKLSRVTAAEKWNQQKIFGCFYGRPSAPRLGIATHLAINHKEKSELTVKFDFKNEDSRDLFDIHQLFVWHPEIVWHLDILKEFINNEEYVRGHYQAQNPLEKLYDNFLIDIVSEPTNYGNAFYPTEKIVRPLVLQRPFIVMGSKNYLIYLRQLGFKTFHDFWDEDYDGFDSREKYHRILKLIDHLATIPKEELNRMYNAMQSILEHNRRLIITQTYNKNVKRLND